MQITKDVDTTKAAKVEAALRDYCKETKIDKEGRFVSLCAFATHDKCMTSVWETDTRGMC